MAATVAPALARPPPNCRRSTSTTSQRRRYSISTSSSRAPIQSCGRPRITAIRRLLQRRVRHSSRGTESLPPATQARHCERTARQAPRNTLALLRRMSPAAPASSVRRHVRLSTPPGWWRMSRRVSRTRCRIPRPVRCHIRRRIRSRSAQHRTRRPMRLRTRRSTRRSALSPPARSGRTRPERTRIRESAEPGPQAGSYGPGRRPGGLLRETATRFTSSRALAAR